MPWWGWVFSGLGGTGILVWLFHRIGWLEIIVECIGAIFEGIADIDCDFDGDD